MVEQYDKDTTRPIKIEVKAIVFSPWLKEGNAERD